MFRRRGTGMIAGLLLGSTLLASAPASAFEIFGFRLWGEPEESDRIEIIDPLDYTVEFQVQTDDGRLESSLESASALWSNREEPASGKSGLISRSKGDYRRLLAALYDAGYYGGEISIRLAGVEAADLTLAADLVGPVSIVVDVVPGPPFNFGTLEFVNPPPPLDRRRRNDATMESIGFVPGMSAEAATLNRASALSIVQWRITGNAKARESGREVVADHTNDTLDARIELDPGRVAHYGPTRVEGQSRTDHEFIAFMADLPEGQRFNTEDVERGRARLGRLGIFRSLRIVEDEEIQPDGSLPMTVSVEDRQPRTIGFGGTLSTIDGIGLEGYWINRNLLGHGERLSFDAGISGLGLSADPDDLDYTTGVAFTKPGVYKPDTNFIANVLARQLDFETYRERSISGGVGLSQQFGDRLTGDLSVTASRARFEDIYGIRHFTTFGLVGNLVYDIRNDPLDATRGYYVAAMLQPFYEAEHENAALRGTIEGRIYKSVAGVSQIGLDRLVMAGRVQLGSYYGPPASESPPDLLFFAGGGGSVRGYAYRSIGIATTTDTGETGTVGGRGLFEGSVEARYRINETFGAVGFVDAGLVTEDPKLSGDSDLRLGVGLGLRYYTGLGPLRVDLATPVNPRDNDDYVALYIGIGQSF